MRAVSGLRITCNNATDDEFARLSIQFARCYYDILGQSAKFPNLGPGALPVDYTREMTSDVYTQYTQIKLHAVSLCHSARQAVVNGQIAKQLVDLFESVVNSSDLIRDMSRTMGSASIEMAKSVEELQEKVQQGDAFLKNITSQIHNFSATFNKSIDLLSQPEKHLEQFKRALLYVICALFIGLFLPTYLVPVIGITLVYWAADGLCRWRTGAAGWDKSNWRIALKAGYVVLAAGYPGYQLFTVVSSAASLVMRAANFKQRGPASSFPRLYASSRQPCGRPRAYSSTCRFPDEDRAPSFSYPAQIPSSKIRNSVDGQSRYRSPGRGEIPRRTGAHFSDPDVWPAIQCPPFAGAPPAERNSGRSGTTNMEPARGKLYCGTCETKTAATQLGGLD
jgi:hypothetical protein